eukprot:GHVU01207980.1.p1 GENE.GHVU01207980.1~~GHVU01207980.1.p1  ORF type:complete len:117 (-),score=1.13 GHVU01207980.1:268-618(-)
MEGPLNEFKCIAQCNAVGSGSPVEDSICDATAKVTSYHAARGKYRSQDQVQQCNSATVQASSICTCTFRGSQPESFASMASCSTAGRPLVDANPMTLSARICRAVRVTFPFSGPSK